MAEFDDADTLMKACEAARDAGFKKMDAYAPLPVHGLSEALGIDDERIQKIVLCAGLTGTTVGFSLMYYITVISYPMNVGGKPLFSWPAYVPPVFETTVLFAALSALIGMCVLNGLPMPYHPVFNNPRFEMASTDRFFLCIEAEDPKFDLGNTRKFLEGLHSQEVVEVAK
ncbi:MAG: DUF3341 domain-containing protein [Acidobacteria bacterium]|nr:DUF3341 domain-containing protein [Acidobacteriota bacterium]